MHPQNPHPSQPPQPVISYQTPTRAVRPQAATVIAIIGTVWASLGILLSLWMIVAAIILIAFGGFTATAGAQGLPDFRAVMRWQMISSAGWALISALLLTASIALLRNASWARKTMIAYAIVALGWIAIGIVGATLAFSAMNRQFTAAAQAGTPTMAVGAPMIGQFITGLFLAAFPIVALVFMTRPRIRTWYDQAQVISPY